MTYSLYNVKGHDLLFVQGKVMTYSQYNVKGHDILFNVLLMYVQYIV